MKRLLILLLVVSGCLGIMDEKRDLKAMALSGEDLGDEGWALTSENLTASDYSVFFARVEESGQVSRIMNKVSVYPESQSAMKEYDKVASSLKVAFPISDPGIGESSLLWTRRSYAYIIFVRGDILVELEYASLGPADPDFLVALAKRVDARIR